MPHSSEDKRRLAIFLDAYMRCSLWSTLYDIEGEESRPLEEDYDQDDFSEQCKEEMHKDCHDFLFAFPEDPVTVFLSGLADVHLWSAGYHFWLTRNGHGTGFWDGDWDKPNFERDWGRLLTERAKVYGSVDLYVGEDGLIYS